MSWESFKRWLSKTFIGSTSEATWVWHRLNPSAPTITIPLKPFYTENKFNASFFQSVLQGTKDETSWDVETSDLGHIICMIEGVIEEKAQAHGIDLLYLNIVNSPRHGRVYLMVSEHGLPPGEQVFIIDIPSVILIDIPSVILKQKEESMQAQPPKEDLLFELNQFPPEGRFHLNQFLLVLSNARLAGTWQVSDQVALATFRELSAKEDLINHMTDNFDVTLSLTHEVREGHEAAGWDLRSVPNLLTRNGYYTPRTSSHSRHEWNNLEHPANGFARAPQHEYSRLPYSGLTNEALVDLLNHYSLTQTLRFRPETNAAQLPAGLLLLDLVCERLMTQVAPAQVAYPSNAHYTPHHFHNSPFNNMYRNGQFAPLGSQLNFSQSQSPMTVGDFKSTPKLMEMMVHVNRTADAMCGPGNPESARISQEIHSAFKTLGDGNWPTGQNLYLLVGSLPYASNAVQAMINPETYTGWVIVDEAAVIEPTFCLYNTVPKRNNGHYDPTIPAINFKFVVGDSLSGTIENIASQMRAQPQIPDDARTDLLAQVVRVLTSKPIEGKEHEVLNFSMGPRSTFSEGLLRAMEPECRGCWIIYTNKTISDDPNDLPERFWFLGGQDGQGGRGW